MTKENVLFAIVGLLAGCIIGFMFANSVNQNAAKTAVVTNQPLAPGATDPSQIPPGHPEIPGDPNAPATGGGMQPQVQAAIEKAKSSPEDFEAQLAAAEMYYQIRRYDGAIEYLLKANKLKPDDYETIVNLGNSYFDSAKYEDAEKWYAAALAKKPEDNNVRTDYGLTFLFREPPVYDRSISEFTKVLEKDPNHIQALQNITVAYTKNGDQAKASETVARLQTADPTNTSIAKLREDIQKLPAK
ncbi:MAG: tetratricopeptide repeat protein [Acidobacteria bacterium]|nr:tetratricopeptide repeat protein [Acidobacteriota bacterium]